MQEVSVLSGDQLIYQSIKCEPEPTTNTNDKKNLNAPPPNNPQATNTPIPSSSPGLLMTSGAAYKPPEASNNWKADIKVCNHCL